MNILIQSHMFPSPAAPMLGTFVQFPARELVKQGHQVTVVCPIPFAPKLLTSGDKARRLRSVPESLVDEGVLVHYPRFFSIPRNKLFQWRGVLTIQSCKGFYERLMVENDFDVIHCHVPVPDGEVGMWLSRRYGIPYGVTVHGDSIYNRIHQNAASYHRIKTVLENAKFVGVVSPALYDLVLESGIKPSGDFKVILNGVNPAPDVRESRRAAPPVKILSVCHMTKRKGIAESLRAVANLRSQYSQLEYHLVGGGQDLAYFKTIAEECGIADIAVFHGPKSNRDCLQMMGSCDIFLLPSWNEAFGVVYIEAMYYGMLTIGSVGEGIDGIIKDGQNGFLVNTKDVDDLTTKLRSILAAIDSLDHIRQAARQTVWPSFSWENYVEQYMNLYKAASNSESPL